MISFDKKAFRGSVFLFFAALFWGSAFVAQKICEDYPFATNTIRFFLGAVVMIPVMLVFDRINIKKGMDEDFLKERKKDTVKGAVICGITLAFGSTFQQVGLSFGTTAGKSGFITSVYIVFIPLIGLIFKNKVGLNVWLAVICAFVGVTLMSVQEDFTFCIGDVLTLVCAFCYAINVLCVARYIGGADCVFFSFIQLLVSGLVCSVALIVVNVIGYEVLTFEVFKFILLPVLYIAVFSCGVAYTFQLVGQKDSPPAPAAVIMSLESVFSLLFSITLGGVLGKAFGVDLSETMTVKVGIGIALVFLGVMLAQFNPFVKNKKKKNNGKVNKK